jgi:hypothetical protein
VTKADRLQALAALVAEWRRDSARVMADPEATDADRSEALLLDACALRVDILLSRT